MNPGGSSPFGPRERGGVRHREQLASTIKRELEQRLARGLADPRVKGMITVTSVTIGEDERAAEVGVSIVPEQHEDLTMHGLRSAAAHLRREVMGRIRSRTMPRLEFVLDRSIKSQSELSLAFLEAERTRVDLEESPEQGEPDERAGGANDEPPTDEHSEEATP